MGLQILWIVKPAEVPAEFQETESFTPIQLT